VSSNMRSLALIGDYPILTPAEAKNLLNSSSATSEGLEVVDIVGPARIDRVEMEYWDGATGWELETVQPVYRFRGTVHNAAGYEGKFTVTLPAVRLEYFE
jgi:hypothetical protein